MRQEVISTAFRSDTHGRRRGMSLVELLAVTTILLMMAGTLGSLALAVQNTHHFQSTHGTALLHAQVTLERIERHIQGATCNASFPGIAVFSDAVGGESFPDTLVIWHPSSAVVDPQGLPRINELIVYCPNPSARQELWEITKPHDSRPAPPLSDVIAWRQELASFWYDTRAVRNVMTDLVRVATLRDQDGVVTSRRPAVRFQVTRRPSAAQWEDFLAGRTAWTELPWVQGISGEASGLCQSCCRIELQLTPAGDDPSRDTAIPFFGSAAVYFSIPRP